MKKCLVVCWFGAVPNYYEFWEKSAASNENYDFLIFTDQDFESRYKNIFFIKKTIKEMSRLFSDKLGFVVDIQKPYKFCDFRPAFGIVFDEYLKQYDFWGHCDFDQIFGSLDTFITDDILNKYDKINFNGHYTLYRNNNYINNLFRKNDGVFSYKEVFSSCENFAFDEFTGIKRITEANKVNMVYLNDFCDINVRYSTYNCFNSKNYKYQIYSWENGKLFKYHYERNKLVKEEKMYLHFQKKHPVIKANIEADSFLICKAGLINFNIELSKKNIVNNNGKMNFFRKKYDNLKYIFKKLNDFINSNNEKKKIWLKQKIR